MKKKRFSSAYVDASIEGQCNTETHISQGWSYMSI